jgi:hypothetical protein
VLGRLARAGLDLSAAEAALRHPGRSSDAESGLSGGKVPVGGAAGEPADPEDTVDAAELGEALLRLVRRARSAGLDPEAVLRERVRRLEAAARAAEVSGS